jgi:hypothetical protein
LTKIIFLKRKKEKRGRYCRKKKVTHCEWKKKWKKE